MKYGESTFDILYLLFAIISGISILRNKNNKLNRLMGMAALILGLGDAFHLVPRVLNYFINKDMSLYLGTGKLVTSITMTIFYVYMFYIYKNNYNYQNRNIEICIWVLALIRCVLCLLPQNGWFTNTSDMKWGIIRNVPFVILGIIICYLYFIRRNEDKTFRNIWIYILLSFAFYMPVAIAASELKILGMLMLPKTICYILMIIAFINKSKHS